MVPKREIVVNSVPKSSSRLGAVHLMVPKRQTVVKSSPKSSSRLGAVHLMVPNGREKEKERGSLNMNVWNLLEETSGALQPACTTHARGASQPVGEDVAKTMKTKHRAIRVLCWGNFIPNFWPHKFYPQKLWPQFAANIYVG